jgi:hypothetical protein
VTGKIQLKELRDIKKMLKWIIVFMRHNQPNFANQIDEQLLDISGILEEIINVKSRANK